jgi:hypothetical protein
VKRLASALVLVLVPASARAQLFEAGLAAEGFLPRATPSEVGLDAAAVERLVRAAESQRSDALIVIKDDRVAKR